MTKGLVKADDPDSNEPAQSLYSSIFSYSFMTISDPCPSESDFLLSSVSLVEPEGDILCDWSSWIVNLLQQYNSLDSARTEVTAVNMPLNGSVNSDLYIAPRDAETPDTKLFVNLPFLSDERQKLQRFTKPVIEMMMDPNSSTKAVYEEILQSNRPLHLHRANKILDQYEFTKVHTTGKAVSRGFTYVEYGEEVERQEIDALVDRVEDTFSQNEAGFDTGVSTSQCNKTLRADRISAVFIGRE